MQEKIHFDKGGTKGECTSTVDNLRENDEGIKCERILHENVVNVAHRDNKEPLITKIWVRVFKLLLVSWEQKGGLSVCQEEKCYNLIIFRLLIDCKRQFLNNFIFLSQTFILWLSFHLQFFQTPTKNFFFSISLTLRLPYFFLLSFDLSCLSYFILLFLSGATT